MFKKNKKMGIIAQNVMAVIEHRIAVKEEKYTEGCAKIDSEAQTKKGVLANALVEEVLSGK